MDSSRTGDVDAVLDLQQTAGNRAVVQLIAASRSTPPPPLQREPGSSWLRDDDDDEATSKVDPGVLVLKPDDSGKPADQMEWDELEDAIDEQESIVRSATQSTPDIRRRRERLAELYAAQQKLGAKAAAGAQGKGGARTPKKRRGKKAPPPVMPPKPETLTRGSIDWTHLPGAAVRRELNLVVAYLAANPPKADREILLLELPNIERAAGAARQEKQQARQAEQVTEALTPKSGSDQDKFDEILRRLQNAEKDPSQEDIWLVHYGNKVLPLTKAQLDAIRAQVGKGLMQAARKISGLVYDVEDAWAERTAHNRSHSRTHRLVRFATGADDIPRSDIDNMLKNSNFYVARIRQLATSGHLIEAGDSLAIYDRNARYYAEKVGNWESELMRGAGRWVLGLTILKEALSIMAGFGAANLAKLAGAGSTIATFKAGLQITAMTTTTGLVTGAVGSEVTGGSWKQGARAGGGAGFGVGSNALTAGIGEIASVRDAAKATSVAGKAWAVTKAVGLETAGNVATSSTQALIEGGDVGEAALGAAVATPISTLGGGVVDKLAKGKVASTVGHTVVGITAGTTGAAATDQSLVAGALTGGGGALYGNLATHFPGKTAKAGAGEQVPENELPGGAGSRPATVDALESASSALKPQAGASATGEPVLEAGGTKPGSEPDGTPAGAKQTAEPGPEPQPNAGGAQDFKTLMKTWKKPDPGKLRPASVKDANGAAQERANIKVHEDIAKPDIDALLVEMDKTAWGSRIADGLRSGELQLTLLPPWELPFGGLHYPGGETYVAWSGSIHEIAANLHHEGSHWLDPHLVSREGSKLGMEAEARAFEYEYRDLVGLPAVDQIHAATRQAYEDVIAATRTPQMPEGNVHAARVAADRVMLEGLRRDYRRVAVESRKEERRKIADRRDVRRVNVDEVLGSAPDAETTLPEGSLEVETVFGDEPTSPGAAPGRAEIRAAPEDTGPNALPHDPVIPPPKANSEQLRLEELLASAVESERRAVADEQRAISNKDKGAAAAARERLDAAGAEIHRIVERLAQLRQPGEGGGGSGGASPAPNPSAPGGPGGPATPPPAAGGGAGSGNTILGMGVGVPETKGAVLPEWRGKPPVVGRNIAHVITSADEAAAIYTRLHAEGQRNTLGTDFAEFEQERWENAGGTGEAPIAWVRASDGVVRFNRSKFTPPNLGGHSNEPLGPIRAPLGTSEAASPTNAPGGAQKPAIFPGSGHDLAPGMRPARVATDAEVRFQVENNPMKVHQSRTDAIHEQYYRMDHGAGEVPDAFWSGGTIIVKKSYPLPDNRLVGDKDNPMSRARTIDPSEYEGAQRKLTAKDEQDISDAVARVRTALEKRLTALRNGRDAGSSHDAYRKVMKALRSANLDQNQVVIDHAEIVWDALHNPSLIAEVLANAYGASLRDVGSGPQSAINRALLREAAKGGPIFEVPLGSDIDKFDFFKYWVQTGRRFYDQVDTAAHGNTTHLVQDLVVDVAFSRLGLSMTSVEFRKALGNVEALDMTDPGRQLWEQMYDATDNGINQPEYLMPAIREVRELRDLR